MNDPIFSPCPAWAEKLAVFQSRELSSADRNELDAHLALCMDCKAVLDKYLELDERLHKALSVRRPLQVSAEMLELENRYIVEEESVVSKGITRDCTSRRKLVFRSVPRKCSISLRISFASKMLDTIAPLLVIGIIIIGFCSIYYMKHPIQGATTAGGHATVTSHPTVTATATIMSNFYPHLATSYTGTIADLLKNVTSPMTLTHMQQNNGQISGIYRVLQTTETFGGSLDTSKNINFIVPASSGHGQLSFTGAVQSDGKLRGSFCEIDQRGSCISNGVFGVWNVAPATT